MRSHYNYQIKYLLQCDEVVKATSWISSYMQACLGNHTQNNLQNKKKIVKVLILEEQGSVSVSLQIIKN